jgi:hypothetical protein
MQETGYIKGSRERELSPCGWKVAGRNRACKISAILGFMKHQGMEQGAKDMKNLSDPRVDKK